MPATRASDKKARSVSGSDRNDAGAFVQSDENEAVGPTGAGDNGAFPSDADDSSSRKKRRPLNWEKDNRPPRPANAFISFKSSLKDGPLKHEYAARLANGENIGVIAQQMWKGLSEDERDKWYVAAEQAKVEHGKKYPDYKYQPQKRKDKKKPRPRKAQSIDHDDDYEEEEEISDAASAHGVGQVEPGEETGTSVFTPSSDFSEDDGLYGEPCMVEVYMGGSKDLDRLYKNGWKWALIRDYDGALPDAEELDDKNPIVHLPNPVANLPTGASDSTANSLAIELINMASVLGSVERGSEIPENVFHPPDNPTLFQQMFSPWDYPPPQSSSFFYDGQPALEVNERASQSQESFEASTMI